MDFWLSLVILLSSTWAVYCILTFYGATAPLATGVIMHPLGKILSILAVVFFCFYQGVLFRVSSLCVSVRECVGVSLLCVGVSLLCVSVLIT